MAAVKLLRRSRYSDVYSLRSGLYSCTLGVPAALEGDL
jgi:hypothetical protein